MRGSIIDYASLVESLQSLLSSILSGTKKRTKNEASKKSLANIWTVEHDAAWEAVRNALASVVETVHLRDDHTVHMFADDSYLHWSVVITPVAPSEDKLPINDQAHAPLAFASGSFKANQLKWPIIEKEAFAIIHGARRFDYLLVRRLGFNIWTDHKNLMYVFDPFRFGVTKMHTLDRLERWAVSLSSKQYVIRHINGGDNVWSDQVTRWGAPNRSLKVRSLIVAKVGRSTDDADFVWPSADEIRTAQQSTADIPPEHVETIKDDLMAIDGTMWIPSEFVQLKTRICIVAHCGLGGHRGFDSTWAALAARFVWSGAKSDLSSFIRSCIHCVAGKGPHREPRPLGSALHGSKPNQVLHLDYLFMTKLDLHSDHDLQYLLLLKDDLSHYTELVPCARANASVAAEAIADWASRFGFPCQMVTDGGSHFVNTTMTRLCKIMRVQHHIVTAYCPWANGTIENLNTAVLSVARTLLSEFRLSVDEWPCLASAMQFVLNHTVKSSLGGFAPITVMTGLPAQSPLDSISLPNKFDSTQYSSVVDMVTRCPIELEIMHKTVCTALSKRRQASRSHMSRGKPANFHIGEFVLLATRDRSTRSKLDLRWAGPYRIVSTSSEWVFQIETILTGAVTTAHSSRLRFYCDSLLEVSAAVKRHAAKFDAAYEVDEIIGHRVNASSGVEEMCVRWAGFEEEDSSWEPLQTLQEDVPALVQAFFARPK